MKNYTLLFSLFALIGSFLLAAPGSATPISQDIQSEVSWREMVGLDVQVVYANGSTKDYEWELLPGGTKVGIEDPSGINLTMAPIAFSEDTRNLLWELSTNSNILSITLNGLSSGIFFDVPYPEDYSQEHLTPGSHWGLWAIDTEGILANYTPNPGTEGTYKDDFKWTFSEELNIYGEPFRGDLFGLLTLDFTSAAVPGGDGFMAVGKSYALELDTDRGTVVPEPTSMLLLGLGLLGAGFMGRRRRFQDS